MSKAGTHLNAVAAADNAFARYAATDTAVSIARWEEDGRPFCPLHMTRKDLLEQKVKPIGWCRPLLQDFIRADWPAAVSSAPIFEFEEGGVYIADWVLREGMGGIEREFDKLASYWKDSGYFAEQLAGTRYAASRLATATVLIFYISRMAKRTIRDFR
jgi:hypothetical protein